MADFPHHYRVDALGGPEGAVRLASEGLDAIESAPPAQFGGPGDRWSPETLLVAAVADCFVLGFRAIARASKFPWTTLECAVEGTLDRADGAARFTGFNITASLRLLPGANEARARRLLEKSEKACLITNSLSANVHLRASVEFEGGDPDGRTEQGAKSS